MNATAVSDGRLVWTGHPDPIPGPGEIAIAVRATAVNRADLLQRIGAYPPPPGASPILGLECSGTIAAVGEGVRSLAVGDRVAALLAGGGYAETVVCPAEHALLVPEDLDLLEAAALPEALCTVYMALCTVGRLAPGERVLLHAAASGIGTAAIQVCAAWGNPCFATASQGKLPRCLALGAEGAAARGEGWASAVRAWAPDGVDVVVDPVGRGYLAEDQAVLALGGRIVLLGLLGGARDELDLARLLIGRQTVAGTTLRSRPSTEKAEIVAGVAARIWPHVAAGRVRPILDAVLPIARAEEAHERLRTDATVGKVVLEVAPEA